MSEILTSLGTAFIVMVIFMVGLWIVSLILTDSSIVDIFWGIGFILMAWTYFFSTDTAGPRKTLIVILVTVWGLRLAGYLLYRNWGKGEDFRYRKWRAETGESWWWVSLFRVFLLQGVLFWFISMPFLAAQLDPEGLNPFDLLGVLVWGIGLFFEAVGDIQLAAFKANPENKGKVLASGLWQYTRHPNYFGDAAAWWGYGLFALATLTVFGVVSLVGPALMTFLLLRVSGVTLLEETLDEKPGYEDYKRRTSAFIPMPPKD
ncbi:MAG: DUF1295 domain-containing protein [Chloroflexi bacterium]|nr:DUF1295 domain-containing protein [Chloroflexota bacterium]